MAHRGRLLEGDADAAACGVFDGLFGRVVRRVVDEVAFETASEKDGMGTVRESVCQWALTKKRTLRRRFEVEAYSRLVICVSLRTAASAEAPWAPIPLL